MLTIILFYFLILSISTFASTTPSLFGDGLFLNQGNNDILKGKRLKVFSPSIPTIFCLFHYKITNIVQIEKYFNSSIPFSHLFR